MEEEPVERAIDYDMHTFGSISGIVYEQRDGNHLLQFHMDDDSGITYEFIVESEEVALGFRHLGQAMLNKMESEWADIDMMEAP